MLAALPGVREVRSALAGGYLWLLLLWLVFDPALGRDDFVGEPYRSARHLGETLGPVAFGIGTSFVAYLLGTFINESRAAMARIYLSARQSENFTPEVAQSRLSKRIKARREMRERINRVEPQRWLARRVLEEMMRRYKYRTVEVPIDFANRFFLICVIGLESLFRPLWRVVRLSFQLATTPIMVVEVAGIALLSSVIAMRAEPYKPFLTRLGVIRLESYLEAVLPSDGETLPPAVADVIADFRVIRTRLIHASIDTVNEVDRLQAEAEFRSSISLPLTLLVGLLAVDTSLWWLLIWPALLTLLIAARERRREAGDLLVDALSQGVVSAPSIDAYRGSDPLPNPAAASDGRQRARPLAADRQTG